MSTKKTIDNKLVVVWLSVLSVVVLLGATYVFMYSRNLSTFETNMNKITSQNRALIRDLRNCINNKVETCELDENAAQYQLEKYPFSL